MQNLKGRLAGKLASGFVGAALDLLDPHEQEALRNYGWDNFMKGELPPPFDWLNPDPNWADAFGGGAPRPITQQSNGAINGGQETDGYYAWQRPPGSTGAAEYSPGYVKQIAAGNGNPNIWNPWYWGAAGGARNTPDLLANMGKIGVAPLSVVGWNWHVIYGTFNQSPIAVSIKEPHPVGPFTWTGEIFKDASRDVARAKASAAFTRTVRAVDGHTVNMAPVAGVPAYTPLWYSKAQIAYANLLKGLAGIQLRDVPDTDGFYGAEPGGKTIIPPRGPIITIPGDPLPRPPGPDTKEKKVRVGAGLFRMAQSLFHGITEYGDAVDALFDAIPKEKRCKTKSLVGKSACIFMHLDDVDIGDAIVNLAWNQFEDYVIGTQLFGRNQRAAQARGDRYAFRTQNSINGFGGVDDLGELYGDFSKEYVNPRKEDLKKFLTDRFGI